MNAIEPRAEFGRIKARSSAMIARIESRRIAKSSSGVWLGCLRYSPAVLASAARTTADL
jgi:hypothetical protein